MSCALWDGQLTSEDIVEKAYGKGDKADQNFCVRRD